MDPKIEPSPAPAPMMCCQPRFKEAVQPSAANTQVQAAIALNDLNWVRGTIITYCFVEYENEICKYISNPDETIQTKMNIARLAWQNWQNTGMGLTIKEVTNPNDAIIRIAFNPKEGSNSGVGINNIKEDMFKKTKHTMNLGDDLEKYPCNAEHEIGHVLGLQHEHQNPIAGIKWNREQVLLNYRGDPNYWEDWKTELNVLSALEGPAEATKWDPDSIMHYPIKRNEVVEPMEIAKNGYMPAPYTKCKYDKATNTLISGLSAGDKALILKMYPPAAPLNETVTANKPVKFNVHGEVHEVAFEFQPPETGDYIIKINGPKDAKPVKSTVMVRNDKGDYVLDKDYIVSANDSDSRLALPFKARPSLIAKHKYFLTALFEKNAKGPFSLEAIRTNDPVDILGNLGGYIGQNMRSGITIVNETSSDITVSITKDIITDSAGWTTIKPKHQDRWGRAANKYTIDMIVEGEQRTLKIKKEGEETIIFVKSHAHADIQVHNAEVLKRL